MNHPQLLAPQRVLMTADTVGGVWTYAAELSRSLADHGTQVLIATMGGAPNSHQLEELADKNIQVAASRFKLEWMRSPWRDVDAAGRWLLQLEQRFNPDVIHLNGYAHAALPWRAPKLVVGHSCVLSWWRAVKGHDAPMRWRKYREKVASGIANANLVVAPTRAMLESLDEHYGPLPEAEVIHNAREHAWFGAGRKECFIFSSGRLWDDAKNIRALANIASRLPWPVFVAGDRTSPDGSQIKLKNVGLLGRLGRNALASLYSRAAIYALPARYEPFGLSVLEAALSGCALVLGDIPSLRELWEDAALFVPPDNSQALEQALLDFIRDASLRTSLAALAQSRAAEFTPQRTAEAYLSAYADIMMTESADAREMEEQIA